ALVAIGAFFLYRLTSKHNIRTKAHKDWSNWRDEVAVVTGGGSGIGADVVKRLASLGTRVAILDLNEPREVKTSDLIRFYQTDVTDIAAIQKSRDAIHKDFGAVSILVNNAGVANAGGGIAEANPKRTALTIQVNLLAIFHVTHIFLPDMLEKNHGHVVTVASAASFAPLARGVDYSVSKAGAMAFVEGLHHELATVYEKPGIHATCVHPGWVTTPMTAKMFKPECYKDFLTPGEVGKAIVDQIQAGASESIYLPASISYLRWLRILP
ncbi:NAD(P)-binding protein, partial [Violaceomyces palustris]